MEELGLTYNDLKFELKSHDTEARFNSILHQHHCPDKHPDSFIYELARDLQVSVDYLYGWTDVPDQWIPSVGNDPYFKQNELIRLVNKYCIENNIDRKNTNILAYKTGIDRQVFDILFNNEPESGWWTTTSYYIISRLAVSFDFNFYTVMSYMLQAEDEDGIGESYTLHLSQRFEDEYYIKTI
jgi:hypothetical protein